MTETLRSSVDTATTITPTTMMVSEADWEDAFTRSQCESLKKVMDDLIKPSKELLERLDAKIGRPETNVLSEVKTVQLQAKAASLRWGALRLLKVIAKSPEEKKGSTQESLKTIWETHYSEEFSQYLPQKFITDAEFYMGVVSQATVDRAVGATAVVDEEPAEKKQKKDDGVVAEADDDDDAALATPLAGAQGKGRGRGRGQGGGRPKKGKGK